MPAPPRPARSRPSLRLRLVLVVFAIVVSLGAVEGALQLAPGLLPTWFREQYPPHGVEFFAPGVLDRTPITAVPLPYGVAPYDGPPPHDLVDLGVATPADAELDSQEVPRLVLPADHLGLPNARRPAQPAVALVGDSFTVFAAQLEPPGLQQRLAERLGVDILNVAISGIGPDQELFLLEEVALPAKPRLVVWLFFGGNDLIDAFWSQAHRSMGIQTYGQLFAEKRAPRWLLPNLLAGLFAAAEKPLARPLPGFLSKAVPSRQLWFYPDTLRVMAMDSKVLASNPGWVGAKAALLRAKARCEAANARLLVVYLPSKEQIFLPRVEADPNLLQRFIAVSSLYGIPVPAAAADLHAAVLANRLVLENGVRDLCAEAGLTFWSASATIEAVADSGAQPYYATDSHWRPAGQLATAEALADYIAANGLLPR